ncbi:hypothetical protein ES703_112339 [subsurface metagenome]
MIEFWFSYSIFRHTREQTIWAIAELFPLNGEVWPKEPDKYITDEFDKESKKWIKVERKSSYIDIKGNTINILAPFIKAKDIYGEIIDRLETTGEAGEALVDEIQKGGITDYEGLSRPAQRALNFISGWRRKSPTYTYSQWKATQKKRGNLP